MGKQKVGNFRSNILGGFNRRDVIGYIEELHKTLNELESENNLLHSKLLTQETSETDESNQINDLEPETHEQTESVLAPQTHESEEIQTPSDNIDSSAQEESNQEPLQSNSELNKDLHIEKKLEPNANCAPIDNAEKLNAQNKTTLTNMKRIPIKPVTDSKNTSNTVPIRRKKKN